MKRMITIIGGSEASSTEFEFAYQLGNLLAEAEYGIVCGGRSGVMEAVCKGSSEAGGFSIGILLSFSSKIWRGFGMWVLRFKRVKNCK